MPGDEVNEGEGARPGAASGARGRAGPRHAAPRKPLLTRFHLPAGKAVALAAMPSAVLLGVGITPQLANAKPLPKNPFKGDSCVSISEQQETEEEKAERKERAEKLKKELARKQAEREKAAEEAAGKADGEKAGEADGKADGTPGDGTSDGGSGGDKPSGSSGKTTSEEPATAPSPSAKSEDSAPDDEEENPWYDPLGVGKTLDDLLHPDKGEDTDEPADEPSDSPAPSPSKGSGDADDGDGSPSGGGAKSGRGSDGGGTADRSGKADGDGAASGSDETDETGKAGKGDDGEDAGDEKDGEDGKPGEDSGVGADAKDGTARDYDPEKDAGKPFPCPEKMDVQGTGEQTPAQVPNVPWQLEASSLTLMGLDYEGVVNITMPNGKTKQALKFTADALDIGDLHQTVQADGVTYHVQAAEGSRSTIRGGKVTMYTEELKGKLFGLIPITFSPETPPPINVPFAYFTDVSVRQAGQFGGTLTIPGLHQYVRQ
ncbi:hypothetical protein [Streptomyces sp. AA1529]|uniref:hypothetical protein n=1 Tax=Streptomyces sp. AA1529 TaxID=1203257 RepID=UPI0002E3693C|nr:hypothetical protein [Streptomyces sp. AA1529]